MRFLVLMRGAITPPPKMLEPVMKIPLGRPREQQGERLGKQPGNHFRAITSPTNQAAPTTEMEMAMEMPSDAHM